MKVERDLYMSMGDGETSYATNSSLQEKAIVKTRPLLHKAVEEAHASLSRPASGGATTMVVADLGCSSGPNTLLVVSEVLGAVAGLCERLGQPPVNDVQFFLNDLPGNDFNLVFRSLELFKKLNAKDKGDTLPAYYVAGLPGSFYTKLFPAHSVHIFHSSYCLMWISKVPDELARGAVLNEGNMYIWETTPPAVASLYQKQFHVDFLLFLRLRHNELISGGQMVLTFLGRKNGDVLHSELGCMWGLLARALRSLVKEGRLEEEKMNSFNLPFYAPSIDEVKTLIKGSELFDIDYVQLFESNWDPLDDLDGDDDQVLNAIQSGVNVAKCIRAVIEPLIAHHFGEDILNDLFEIYAHNVAKHLEKVKTKYPIIILSLKAICSPNSS